MQDGANIFDPRNNLTRLCSVVRSWRSERFNNRGECLLDVKVGVAFPTRVDIEFPTHARQCRTDQLVIDLLRNRPGRGVDLLPARLEFFEVLSAFADAEARPVARAARSLDAVHIIAGERRIFFAPVPEIVRQFIQRLSF